MPRIFDNIDQPLLQALQQTLESSTRADFCVSYFNLRGWKRIAKYIENWHGGDNECCGVLVGMQRLPDEELRHAMRVIKETERLDNQTALRIKKSWQMISENNYQLEFQHVTTKSVYAN